MTMITSFQRRIIDALEKDKYYTPSLLSVNFCDMGQVTDLVGQAQLCFCDNSKFRRGMDTEVVIRSNDGRFVFKVLRMQDGLENCVQKLIDHNQLFGDRTKYEIIGLAHSMIDTINGVGEVVMPVVRQPYIEFEPRSGNDARCKLKNVLKKRFGKVRLRRIEYDTMDWFVGERKFFLDDLKDSNIGIDIRTGDYAVLDCIIHRGDPFGWWNEAVEI